MAIIYAGCGFSDKFSQESQIHHPPNVKVFTYDELKTATKNFMPETVLGEGGFGKVYKGLIGERTLKPLKSERGTLIAVKRLKTESLQGFQEWQLEINVLGNMLQHASGFSAQKYVTPCNVWNRGLCCKL